MHRALTVVVVLALVAGSVPAAASLADGTPEDSQPGASFSGVVGVQESEVNSEVAERSLDQRLNAAKTNSSKASVVAQQSDQLAERLAELEAEKERLKQAYENGSISKGQYQARLAVLAAELRAVERRANKTATVAEDLPAEVLRENGANVSEVRAIAQQANETGGGEVAEAARDIAGAGVGNGLGNAPNASQGPPEDRGGAPVTGNGSDQKPAATGTNTNAADAGNGDNRGSNGSSDGSGSDKAAIGAANNTTDWGWNGGANASDGSDTANRSSGGNGNDGGAAEENGTTMNESASATGENGQNSLEFGNPTDWFGSVTVDGVVSGVDDAVSGFGSTFSA